MRPADKSELSQPLPRPIRMYLEHVNNYFVNGMTFLAMLRNDSFDVIFEPQIGALNTYG